MTGSADSPAAAGGGPSPSPRRRGRGLPDATRALAELMLIVVGVLIALAADSWLEARQDRQLERAYLEQLLADVRQTERRLEDAIADEVDHLTVVASFLALAEAGETSSSADALGMRTSYSLFEPVTGTSTALVQSGDIQLLRSDSVRFQLVAWSAAVASAEAWLGHTVTQTWRNTEQVLRAWRSHMQPSPEERRTSAARWRETADAEAALRDPALVSAMSVQHAVNRNRMRRLEALEEPTATLRRLLERELGIE